MRTEDDAMGCWCPFARAAKLDGRDVVVINRVTGGGGEIDMDCFCIGGRCMAWRVADDGEHGYCGLAGKP